MENARINQSTIESLMKVRGYETSRQLAAALNIKHKTLARIRSGKHVPGSGLVEKICGLLDTTPARLIFADKSTNLKHRSPRTNNKKPGGSLTSPATIQTPEESVEDDTVRRMLDPAEQAKASEFGLAVVTKMLNGRTVSEELRAKNLRLATASFWFDLYDVDSASELLQYSFDQELEAEQKALAAHAEVKAPNAESVQAEAAPIEIPAREDAPVDEPVEIPAVIDAEVYYTPDLDRPVRLPALQDMPLEPDKAA
jgi:transcriptional regulator with XRE-family HTH domain